MEPHVARCVCLLLTVGALADVATSFTQFLPGLPAEAQNRIVSLLPDRARVSASSVSKGWRAVLKPWLYRSVLVKLPNIASDDDAVRWVRMLEGMSDHDTSLVATAFHALQPCPKFDIISAVLKALAQPSVHVKRSKAIIQILHCIGIPSHVLVAACLRLRLLHLRTNSRAESLWKSVISCTPMHDPVRRALPVVGVWTSRTLNTLKGTPYGYAMEATIETWNSADDAQRESLILYGLDCHRLMDSLPSRDIVRLYRRFGFLPSGYVAATFVDLQTRLEVVAELTKDVSAPMFVVVRFLEFHDLIRLSPETALRFARRFHPLTGLSPLPDDIVQAVLTTCPDHISKQILPLIVTSAPFHKHMKISSDPASSIPEHVSLLVRLTGMFRPRTPILNVILDYLAITIPVRGACSHRRQMARLPLAARFSDTHVMMGMFDLYVNNIPAGAPVMDTDSDGRTSLHALADVIESTGWYPGYHRMLTGLVLSAGPERAADFVAQEDGRSRTFLDIVAGGALDDLVKCIEALTTLDQHWDLFARVALPTSTNQFGQTVLHYPAFYASASGLSRELVLRRPELLGVRDRYGRSVLHVAVASSCYQAVAWYLSARPELLFVVDHADATVLHDVGPSRTSILMVSALMSVPMTAAAAMHLLTVRDRHGRTAVDAALGKGDLGRHHKVRTTGSTLPARC